MTALSQAVALLHTAVQARISRLERDKVIVAYRATLGEGLDDPGVLGAVLSIVFSQRPCAPRRREISDIGPRLPIIIR